MSNPERAYADRSVDAIIGENIHRLMWRAGEKQLHVAPQLGMTQGAMSRKLRGDRPWFASELEAVGTRYGVAIGDLFRADFTPPETPEAPRSTV